MVSSCYRLGFYHQQPYIERENRLCEIFERLTAKNNENRNRKPSSHPHRGIV